MRHGRFTSSRAWLARIASCLMAASCAPPAPKPEPSSVLVITLDTLRADHLSCYGYGKPTSPNIDAFAREATRYSECLAPASWTLPSHASLFTGRFPSEHGARVYRVKKDGGGDQVAHRVGTLEAQHVTLAEVFLEENYATAAFVANAAFLSRSTRLDQGFRVYDVERVAADSITDRALAWLRVQSAAPYFMFLNYMDAHCPCSLAPRSLDPLPAPSSDDGRPMMERLSRVATVTDEPLPQELIDDLIGQYDNGIAFADEHVGRLLDGLRKLGRYDSTLIVITSDHGEFFGEHRLAEHGRDVYQEVLWVPLLVKLPRQREGRVDTTRVSLVDVPNLILRELAPALSRDWTEHFRYAPGNHPMLAESHYTRHTDFKVPEFAARFDRVRRALFDGPYKYVESSDGKHELYDLASDPREQRDLSAERPQVLERMAAALKRFDATIVQSPHAAREIAPTASDEKALRELGYF